MLAKSKVLLTMLLLVLLAAPAWSDDDECQVVSGTGTGVGVLGLQGFLAGTAPIQIGDENLTAIFFLVVTSSTTQPDGTRVGTGVIVFRFGPGDSLIVANERFTLTPSTTPGTLLLEAVAPISDGKGRFKNWGGKLRLSGTNVSLPGQPTTGAFTIQGRLCDDDD